jgi:phosphoribosyl-ATP pyrophosphohydrolase
MNKTINELRKEMSDLDYYMTVAKTEERIRILDILTHSNIDKQTLEQIRKQIKV